MRYHLSRQSIIHSVVVLSIVIAALSASIAAVTPVVAQVARGGSGASFNFLPVYPGKNSGDAIGAVGSHAGLEVSNLTAAYGWPTGATVDVSIVALQKENPDGTCGGAAYTTIGTYPIAAAGSGSFTATFLWPTAATKSAGPVYATCLKPTGVSGGWKTSAKVGDVGNPGTFTVTTDAAATLVVTPTEIHRGESLTVTGKNWLPIYTTGGVDTHVTVAIGKCNSGISLGATTPTVDGGDGSFTTTFTIPDTADLTTYEACAFTNGSAQAVDHNPGSSQTPPTFQVIATAPTPTAVPPTATSLPPTATATTVVVGTGTTPSSGAGGSGSANRNNDRILAVVLGLIAIILLGAGLLLFFLRQRPHPPQSASGPMPPNTFGPSGPYPAVDQSWGGGDDTQSGTPTVWQNPVNPPAKPPTKPTDKTDPIIWG